MLPRTKTTTAFGHRLHPLTIDMLDDTSDNNEFADMPGSAKRAREAEKKNAGVGWATANLAVL